MERWYGKTAVVTGASTGIGASIATTLANAGMIVVGMSRRIDKIELLSKDVTSKQGKLIACKCDVSKQKEVVAAFAWVEQTLGGVDVLVSNAGIANTGGTTVISDNHVSYEACKAVVDTNLMGTIACVQETARSLKNRHVTGHIILMNSIYGHYVPYLDYLNVYTVTKHGITAFTECLRQEFAEAKSKTKITSISPGAVGQTEIFDLGSINVSNIKNAIEPQDVADAVIYVLSTPPNVNVQEIIIRPVGEMF